jgi:hypothetical protein
MSVMAIYQQLRSGLSPPAGERNRNVPIRLCSQLVYSAQECKLVQLKGQRNQKESLRWASVESESRLGNCLVACRSGTC